MVNCTINGRPIQVPEGTTIIQAMLQNGLEIAHYCYHPGLSVAGVCRLCFVEIEGNPRLQIACNTVVQEGMKISNQTPAVKKAVEWGLKFHLINHPLDCPICDQAGECGLQELYLKYGRYDSAMAEPKVKKRKVVDLGRNIVLDTERCILCSRCVRFTDEVTRTHELGIFNRGDRSEIGTFQGKTLDNNAYSVNVVDICPVGALTSRDFRFKQRVWFLKSGPTLCNGCSTGCHVRVDYNLDNLYRVKPIYSAINSWWMCDDGRHLYRYARRDGRIAAVWQGQEGLWRSLDVEPAKAVLSLKDQLKGAVAVLITGFYTQEEYEKALPELAQITSDIYIWRHGPLPQEPEFDGLLRRKPKAPNEVGLEQVMQKLNLGQPWPHWEQGLAQDRWDTVIVLGPENLLFWESAVESLLKALEASKATVIWLQTGDIMPWVESKKLRQAWIIPGRSYLEKQGSFVNYQGLRQYFDPVTVVLPQSLSLDHFVGLLKGRVDWVVPEVKKPINRVLNETRKHNEFVHERGFFWGDYGWPSQGASKT